MYELTTLHPVAPYVPELTFRLSEDGMTARVNSTMPGGGGFFLQKPFLFDRCQAFEPDEHCRHNCQLSAWCVGVTSRGRFGACAIRQAN